MVCRPTVLIGAQIDLAALDLLAIGNQRIGDVAGRDRTVKLAGFAGLTDHDDGLAVEIGSDLFSVRAALGVTGFDHLALGFELGAVGIRRTERLALRQQEVTAEPVLDGDFVADGAQTAHALEKNDFH
jgi:hypothetical protein